MASVFYQLCHRYLFIRTCGFLITFHKTRVYQRTTQVAQSSIPSSGRSNANYWLVARSWRLPARQYTSSGDKVQPADEENAPKHLLPFDKQSQQIAQPSLQDCELPAKHPLENITEDEAVQINAEPPLPACSNTLKHYVEQSETLRQLVLLGVDLSKLEQRPNVGNMLIRLDFEKDIKEKLLFLKEVGVPENQLGPFLTKNPFILTENLEDVQIRVSYLKSKKFTNTAIARIISKAPYLLNFNVERIDNRLGFYQKELGLSKQKTMNLVTRLPRLLTGSLEPVKENLKVYEIEFGFHKNEIQHIISTVPKVLTANKKKITAIFDYVHNTMGVPHHMICKFPQVLNCKLLRIKERHLFLKYLGRAQYDPNLPNYVSLDRLASLTDEVFCREIALATVKDFEIFQKTL
ncbi:transcription termination factor 3, mitochondrial [Erpetoichthys calabaricus]|uniref:Transcription termination factor 3, mitochondrial n=1 Tax=Erpetoichthys calabaricus TaxID=27687 RepID=A0A8C4TEV8_ERPCA|nr:transcription termination factor 3, mitochondrial [Erpetoichthys calabaricus]XP_028673078.1 transcription termination factor 3, mitochondrial [Erpetoichthys calabaricus]